MSKAIAITISIAGPQILAVSGGKSVATLELALLSPRPPSSAEALESGLTFSCCNNEKIKSQNYGRHGIGMHMHDGDALW